MEGLNLTDKLGRVEAPPGFEQRVLAQLSLRKQRRVRVKRLRFSMAGAVSAAAVLVLVFNFVWTPTKGGLDISGLEQEIPADFMRGRMMERGTIPITESVNYTGEMRSLRSDPPTIYILEQISDTTDTKIKY